MNSEKRVLYAPLCDAFILVFVAALALVLTASLLTPEEKAAYSGELSPNPARLAALWFLIALALSAILIGSAARVPLTSAITVLTEEPNPSGDALSDTTDEKPNQPKEDRTEW